MLNSLNRKYLYFSIVITFILFLILNFVLGPTSVFGLSEFIENKTGYFFGVDTNTFDYFLIASLPIFGLLLNTKRKRNSLSEILKDNLVILFSCIGTFIVGLLLLLSKIGNPGINPLIPQYLRVEPFDNYSSIFITIGIIIPFIFMNKIDKENIIEEIGEANE